MSIIFENPGLINLDTINTFGVSVKETDNPIGMFGTGLKYALAVLIRTNHQVTIIRGEDKYEITAKTHDIRDKEFSILYMNDEKLPFTTHLGHKWEVWMAYRELYSNALDEGGKVYKSGFNMLWDRNATYIIVAGTEIETVYNERHKYFLSGIPIDSSYLCEVYDKPSHCIFYRGIRALELPKPSLFTYNIVNEIALTEDRTINSEWTTRTYIAKHWQQSEHKKLKNVLLGDSLYYEREFQFYDYNNTSQQFLDICEEYNTDFKQLNPSAYSLYKKKRPNRQIANKRLNSIDEKVLMDAIDTLRSFGIVIRHPIIVVEDLGNNILGAATEEQILISYECFLKGDKTLIGTIYEEHIHLTYGYADCSREMQNHLLDRLIAAWSHLAQKES